jgi:hypothetical protein
MASPPQAAAERIVEPVEKAEMRIGKPFLEGPLCRVLGMLPAPIAGLMVLRDSRFLR